MADWQQGKGGKYLRHKIRLNQASMSLNLNSFSNGAATFFRGFQGWLSLSRWKSHHFFTQSIFAVLDLALEPWRWSVEEIPVIWPNFLVLSFYWRSHKDFSKNAQVLPNLVEATAYFLLRPDLPPSLFSRVTFSLNDDDDWWCWCYKL